MGGEAMLLEKFIINGRIQIVNNKTTFSGFVKVINEDHFIVQIATAEPNVRPIQLGEKIEFLVSFETEALKCATNVLEIKVSDQSETIKLSVPEVLLRVERRQFIRLDTILPISYFMIPVNEFYRDLPSIPTLYWKKVKNTFTVDISGGGLRMITYEESEIGRGAAILFPFREEIKILGTVARSEKDLKNNTYKTAFQFEDMKPAHRELIINYVKEKVK